MTVGQEQLFFLDHYVDINYNLLASPWRQGKRERIHLIKE